MRELTFEKDICFLMKVSENSFFAIVLVRSFEIRLLKNSFSKIFLIEGLFWGSLINISASKSFKS